MKRLLITTAFLFSTMFSVNAMAETYTCTLYDVWAHGVPVDINVPVNIQVSGNEAAIVLGGNMYDMSVQTNSDSTLVVSSEDKSVVVSKTGIKRIKLNAGEISGSGLCE